MAQLRDEKSFARRTDRRARYLLVSRRQLAVAVWRLQMRTGGWGVVSRGGRWGAVSSRRKDSHAHGRSDQITGHECDSPAPVGPCVGTNGTFLQCNLSCGRWNERLPSNLSALERATSYATA